jgi:Tfp pilus assembly protein PilN
MYRINLYRDYAARQQREKKRTVRTGVVAGIVGLGILFLCGSMLSVFLLQERIRMLRAEIDRLSSRALSAGLTQTELEAARGLVKVRQTRMDWSPKIAALSQDIDPRLQLVEVVGQVADKGRPARFSLVGVWRGTDTQMEPVSRFMDQLRKDQRISRDFPGIQLGTVQTDQSNRFQVICEPPKAGSGS